MGLAIAVPMAIALVLIANDEPGEIRASEGVIFVSPDFPQAVDRPSLSYPLSRWILGIEGNVELAVDVRRDGTVADCSVKRSAGLEFDEAAIAAVRRWRFSVVDPDSGAGTRRCVVPVRFRLEEVPLPDRSVSGPVPSQTPSRRTSIPCSHAEAGSLASRRDIVHVLVTPDGVVQAVRFPMSPPVDSAMVRSVVSTWLFPRISMTLDNNTAEVPPRWTRIPIVRRCTR
jgi:TonB family protein